MSVVESEMRCPAVRIDVRPRHPWIGGAIPVGERARLLIDFAAHGYASSWGELSANEALALADALKREVARAVQWADTGVEPEYAP